MNNENCGTLLLEPKSKIKADLGKESSNLIIQTYAKSAASSQMDLPENERKHKCDQCEKSFAHLHYLKQHLKSIHTEERPFVCQNLCGYSCMRPVYISRQNARVSGLSSLR